MPSPILVTGGTGTLGSHVVRHLGERDRQVRVLSRKERPAGDGVEYVVGDLASGSGVDEAVAGVDVIVHCASAQKGDEDATRNLVQAAAAQGRRPHLVFISIIGVNGIPFGYFKTKLAAENVVAESSLSWTILRATQFYDFILNGAESLARLPIVPAPRDFRCQPIDTGEVADRLVELALGPPSGRVPDIGGPEVSTWAEMVRQYLRAAGRRRPVVEVWLPMMKAIRAGGLLVGGGAPGAVNACGRTTWQEFLQRRLRTSEPADDRL
jgi:uncharacterized protein YbjT (DUF2867 family)